MDDYRWLVLKCDNCDIRATIVFVRISLERGVEK